MRYIISFLKASTATVKSTRVQSALVASVLALPMFALSASADVPRVVADIPPVHALVSLVMGDLGQPTLLLDKGASEHEFQLRPSQAAEIARAGLIVWVGPELTPWLDGAIDALGEGAPSLGLLTAEGTALQPYAEAGTDHDAHETEAEAEVGAEAHDHDHGHSGMDPHAWLDPGNAKIWLGLIAQELGRIDPEHAAIYAANATKAVAGVDTLDAELAALLAPAKPTPLVMAHAAYGYFAHHYGLTVAGSVALGDATAPGAVRITALQATLAADAGICLFPEPQHDPALLTQLAEATGTKVGGPLDPVGSTLTAGPDAYATLMRGLAQTIADCAAR